ncbi:MAG: hypothetical protein SGPRY_009493 [Prymnesium sp.]
MQRETKIPKFKRCKIAQPQLLILMQSFEPDFLCRLIAEDDPLPSFDKRQTLAKELGMTPRSVQIWFQNRRQRLLKPMRQGENEAEDEMHLDSSAVRASSSGDIPISEQQQRDLESQYAKLAAQAFGPLVRGEQAAQSGALPMWRNISSNSVIGGWNEDPASYPFSLIPQAVASGQLAPNAAAMIMQALQQQMDVRNSTNARHRPAQHRDTCHLKQRNQFLLLLPPRLLL